MSNWDVLSDLSGRTGRYANIASHVFDFINTGGVSSSGLIRDINTNGFLATNSIYSPEYFVRMFDEPTYLTFKIEFIFHNPRNALYTNTLVEQYNNYDPTKDYTKDSQGNGTSSQIYTLDGNTEYIYDYLPEAFLQDSMIAKNDGYFVYKDKSGYSPISGEQENKDNSKQLIEYYYSAEDYLGLNRGEYGRAKLMKKIKMILKDLQDNFPYYFKSIDGLSNLNKISPDKGRRLEDDIVLTIKCYEGIDLKITQLLQMIRKVVWDDMYQRWVLPDIMRYFGMRIYVSEIRTFHEAHALTENFNFIPKLNVYNFRDDDTEAKMRNATELPMSVNWSEKAMNAVSEILTASQALGNQFFKDTELNKFITGENNKFAAYSDIANSLAGAYQTMCISAINEVMPTICYECHMCEFDISDTVSDMNTLNSTAGDPQEQTIKIKVKQVEDYQVYPLDRNLASNAQGTAYVLDNHIYGGRKEEDLNNKDVIYSEEDDSIYKGRREKWLTGSTIFSDRLFAETFNGNKRRMFDDARSRGNTVNEMSLYRNLVTEYDDAVKNYFTNLGFTILNSDANTPISPRQKMYSGDKAKELMYKEESPLRYKRNSLDTFTNVMSMIIGELNYINGRVMSTGYVNNLNNFSRATSIRREDLESTLPDIHAAALALQQTIAKYQESDFGDTNLGTYALTKHLAYSKATRYTPLGLIAGVVLNSAGTGEVSGPWSATNRYATNEFHNSKSAVGEDKLGMNEAYNNRYVNSPNGARPFRWSTIAQEPSHNR